MKYIIPLFLLSMILTSCGGSKKAVATSPKTDTPIVVADTVVAQEVIKDTIVIDVSEPDIDQETGVEITMEEETVPDNTEMVEVFNHSVWNSLLKNHVSIEGNVNYEGFRQNRHALREYIASLGAQMPTEDWSQEDRLAYWMNAYNAMTVDLILRNLPLESIKDIDKPWNQRLWKLGSKWYNLDEIEHQILRKMDEPRIHFGINCASFSCPPLLNEAFTAKEVDGQLDTLAKQFVNDPQRNTITAERIRISKIFSWFAKDFKKDGSLIDYLNKYSETPINSNARKSFMDYDWALNN
ncbi:DUF547 domain-containing protein [Aureisphaera galaxeae]|uniref:DUF547 domain-containing protein n=1 Tax=Aureisphaera galaxeae TaxID=1538023 RepID=UPI002350E600|nr:DUF547 domain-containing protein [Aureisphaera galaxeae]MDC8002976.1 DUF547 domain-containing protein [Aureisphaera galaxeae]